MSRKWVVGVSAVVVVALAVFLYQQAQAPAPAVQSMTPAEYTSEMQNQRHFLLDVRTPEEYAQGHIANAANISVDTLAANLQSVPRDQAVVVYCHSGRRATQAAQLLSDAGYTQIYNLGGIADWEAAGLPVEKS